MPSASLTIAATQVSSVGLFGARVFLDLTTLLGKEGFSV